MPFGFWYNNCMQVNEFINKLDQNGIKLDDSQIQQFQSYAEFLVEYNEKINLTAITDIEEIYEKHFYDSLISSFERQYTGTLVDVGTGAGFPGVVLKIAYPDLKVILIEPLKKRCVFLNELILKLGLKDIEVINARGEEYALSHREQYDYVTARAVSNLNALIEICGAMVKVGGYFVALRALSGLEEIAMAKNAIKQMNFKLEKVREANLSDGSLRVIGYLKKIKASPLKFPRNYSMIKRKPL